MNFKCTRRKLPIFFLFLSYVISSDRFVKQQYVASSTIKCFQAIVVFVLCLFLFANYNVITNPKSVLYFVYVLFCKTYAISWRRCIIFFNQTEKQLESYVSNSLCYVEVKFGHLKPESEEIRHLTTVKVCKTTDHLMFIGLCIIVIIEE